MGMTSLPTSTSNMPSWSRDNSIMSPTAGITTTETAYLNSDGTGRTATLGNARLCLVNEHWNFAFLEVVLPADSTAGVKFVISVNKSSDDTVIEAHTYWFFGKGTYFLPLGIASPSGTAAVVSYAKLAITNSDVNPMHYRLAGIVSTQN